MVDVRYVTDNDKSFWFSLDKGFCQREFEIKIRDKRGYVISAEDAQIGIMRYNLIWVDNTPFLTLIYIVEAYQGMGYGKQAMLFWEDEMRGFGYKMVMTSTQVDEQAQHFYRKLGYVDRGGIFLDNTPIKQPQEMFMIKILCPAKDITER
jgi:GNAT superfamily N-acetyltransferase